MNYKTFGVICLIGALGLLATIAYHNSTKSRIPLIFSPHDMLAGTWAAYKKNYIESTSGRTLDKQNNNITTSEAESYTMLRAVWTDDQATFDQSWQWTEKTLKQPNSNLFSWLYGQKSDGTYGIRTDINGQNTASDADTDIALALLMAYGRWQDTAYLNSAQAIISDIWNKEVVSIQGKPYLAADDLEKNSSAPTIVVNPSYFSPAAYRIFANVDSGHPWEKLVDNSYVVLLQSMQSRLDKSKSDGLPPDWILVDRTNGSIQAGTGKQNLTTNYSFDAMRVPWRVALDWQWNQDSRAKNILAGFSFLKQQWNSNKKIYAGYEHNGTVAKGDNFESPAMYGASLGYFVVEDAQDANAIYENKLQVLYDPDNLGWRNTLSYYDDNWAWFGIALYDNSLTNLARSLTGA